MREESVDQAETRIGLLRYYDPNLQRWLNKDPLGEPEFEVIRGRASRVAVVNNYTFVLNDPIEWTDPTGLKIGSGQVHGNWCGGDWTGGLPEEYNPADEGLHKAPTNALDTACQTHDKCYFK